MEAKVTPMSYNCGEGDAVQRMSHILWQMNHATTPVTRAVCRDIVAQKLVERTAPSQGEKA